MYTKIGWKNVLIHINVSKNVQRGFKKQPTRF